MRRWWLIIPFFVVACTSEEEPPVIEDIEWTKQNSTDFGKSVAIQEEIDIKLFLEMHKDWKMKRTGSGLQYYIYEEGQKDTALHAKGGDIAEIEYVVTLLNGDECYRTESDEYEQFVVERSEIESGIQEGIKLLSPGDRAKLIIPSHLAHGVSGDMDKIPPLTTLVFDIYLMGIIQR